MPEKGPTSAPLLSVEKLHLALLDRHAAAKLFPDRDKYVGASEVGSCLRYVAWRKLHPEHQFDAKAAGRMRAGQVLENEFVQLVRMVLGGLVRETGQFQAEQTVEDAPLRCHPDGRLMREAFAQVLASGLRIVVLKRDGTRAYIDDLPPGDGVLEIKTGSAWVVKSLSKSGLSPQYHAQTQVELGSSNALWGILLMGSRDNLADMEVVFLEFDPEEYAGMKARARIIMDTVDKISEGILDPVLGLPEPEVERGWCSSCPCADSCPAIIEQQAKAGTKNLIPPDQIAEFEAMVEEYLETQPAADRYADVKDLLKKRAEALELAAAALPSGTLIKLSPRKGRTTYDAAVLKKWPEVEKAARRQGDPYNILNVEPPK